MSFDSNQSSRRHFAELVGKDLMLLAHDICEVEHALDKPGTRAARNRLLKHVHYAISSHRVWTAYGDYPGIEHMASELRKVDYLMCEVRRGVEERRKGRRTARAKVPRPKPDPSPTFLRVVGGTDMEASNGGGNEAA